MSEAPKTVETPVVAPETTPTVEETPKPTTETVEPATTSETPATTEAVKEEEAAAAAPAKEEVKPVEEGTLGYKGPGLLKYVATTLFRLCCSTPSFCVLGPSS